MIIISLLIISHPSKQTMIEIVGFSNLLLFETFFSIKIINSNPYFKTEIFFIKRSHVSKWMEIKSKIWNFFDDENLIVDCSKMKNQTDGQRMFRQWATSNNCETENTETINKCNSSFNKINICSVEINGK